MQTLKTSNAVFTLSPTRNVGELQAKLAKCDGKYKPTKIKADKRQYPTFCVGMSTAEYVRGFYEVNDLGNYSHMFGVAQLNCDPCTLYTGEDSHEFIDEQPDPIYARELQGAELDEALEEFAFA